MISEAAATTGCCSQFSAGLRMAGRFQANYVWSHSINDGSVGGGEANAPQNALCFSCERGPSIYDIRHNVVVNTVYLLPFGPNQRFLAPEAFRKSGRRLATQQHWHVAHRSSADSLMNVPGKPGSRCKRPSRVNVPISFPVFRSPSRRPPPMTFS